MPERRPDRSGKARPGGRPRAQVGRPAGRPRAQVGRPAQPPRAPLVFRDDIPPLAPPAWFIPDAAAMGVAFEPGEVDRLGRFLAMLLDANTTVNLTAITDADEAWRRHILDALALVPLLADLPDGSSVIDVGSGGGVPGIPLAIVLPRLRFSLLEPTGKKAAFLAAACSALKLDNTSVIAERAEKVGQDHRAGRESFDCAIARALGHLAVVAELCIPLVKYARPAEGEPPASGIVLAVKGERATDEIAEAAEALRRLRAVHAGTIGTPTGKIVVLEKVGPTPRDYPRRDGEPRRSPLGLKRPG